MSKGKPRLYPDKRQNKKGKWCSACDSGFKEKVNNKSWFDEESQTYCICEYGEDVNICHGNPHNCIKTYYHRAASRSNIQVLNNVNIK